MSDFFIVFSTREVALLIWFLLFVIYLFRTKKVRSSIGRVVIAFFKKKVILTISSLLLYMLLIVSLLSYFGLWDISLLKDTCYWILFSGFSLFLNIGKGQKRVNYLKLIKSNFQATAIMGFIINYYTFCLIGELILIPIIFFLITIPFILKNCSPQVEGNEKIIAYCNRVLGIIILFLLFNVSYKIIIEYKLFITCVNLKCFLLPVVFFVLSIPYFYFLALYINYESLIGIIKYIHRNEDSSISKDLIKAILKYANFKLNALKRIQRYHMHFDVSRDNPFEFIKKVSKKFKYTIGTTAKLTIFNNVHKVIINLSNNGIGKMSEWSSIFNGEDNYYAYTNCFNIKVNSQIPNTLTYNLTGKETYVEQLDLILNIDNTEQRKKALDCFIELVKLTFGSLFVLVPKGLISSIIAHKGYKKEYNTHKVMLYYEQNKQFETYILTISTKLIQVNKV